MWSEEQANEYDEEWEDYDDVNKWYKDGAEKNEKGTSSKDSSYIFVSSTKGSPQMDRAAESSEAKELNPKKEDD